MFIIVIIVMLIILIVSTITFLYFYYSKDYVYLICIIGLSISTIFFIIFITCFITINMNCNAMIVKFNTFKHNIEIARKNESIENAAILNRITKYNEWLAECKYWNSTGGFDLFYPDEINKLEFIK